MALTVEAAIQQLSAAVRNRKLVIFVGAGVSLEAGLPTAREFVKESGLGDLSWLRAADVLANDKTFEATFRERFGAPSRPSKQHRLLASLDAPYYITTNYDLLLEKALKELPGQSSDDCVGVVNKASDLPSVYSYKNIVIKLHGDVNCYELLVFDSSDYMKRWRLPSPVDGFVSHIFATHHILFIGYSLEDLHIVELVREGVRHAATNPPKRFMVVSSTNQHLEKYLNTVKVKPILVCTDGDNYEDAVCEFLYRLWEQRDDLSIYTRIIEKSKPTPKEKLEQAIMKRQTRDLEGAEILLDSLFRNGFEEFLSLDHVSSFLWLNVSVLDKLEKWDELRNFDSRTATPIFARLKKGVPTEIYDALLSAYKASMAIAFVRSGDFEEALECAEVAIKWKCTNTADSGLQILKANCHVSHAIALLGCMRMGQRGRDVLEIANQDMKTAWNILKKHGCPDTNKESHHLGRYFGTQAFLDIASWDFKDGGEDMKKDDVNRILGYAKKSYESRGNRTGFGKVAGCYCEAYCYYWLALKFGEPEQSRYLNCSKNPLSELKKSISGSQAFAQFKVLALEAEVKKLAGEPPHNAIKSKLSKLRNRLTHRADKDQLGTAQWLALPLN
jgi:hypothetical protein